MLSARLGLTAQDFEFGTRQVQATSSAGTPYLRRVSVGVPKIPQDVIKTVFFLYRTEAEALADENRGGTGFLVVKHFNGKDGDGFCYAVSNWHVAVDGYPVIRLATKDGGFDVFDLGAEDWIFRARGYDLAAVQIPLNEQRHAVKAISTSMFATREVVEEHGIAPGEDVFMVGLFVDHHVAGKPALRFGNISMNPAPIPQSNGAEHDSYCVDIHSRTGFSGSPVFVWRTPGQDLTSPDLNLGDKFLYFLGAHFAQFPEEWELIERIRTDSDPQEKESAKLSVEGTFVKGMSGMTCVAPAWAVLDLLDHPKLEATFDQARLERSYIAVPVPEPGAQPANFRRGV